MAQEYKYEKASKDPKYFRDSIATVNAEGKRNWLYVKQQKGKFYQYRTWLGYALLTFLFTGPFIRFSGQPLLMLNIIERKFIIFGVVILPQDFHILAMSLITGIVFVILFTVIYGRIFCGWICPQTIFMESIFRKLEYAIEGSDSQQRKLSEMPWNREKILKRGGKIVLFYLISFLIGNTFLAYIIGSDALFKMITEPISSHLPELTAMFIFSGVFFFVFNYMREQVCIAVCPYGRLQGVMLDRDSIVVHYDFVRGEPRGRIKKTTKKPQSAPLITADTVNATNPILAIQGQVANANGAVLEQTDVEVPKLGDCIDCGLCVKVCPTGIDIRNGTQLECINCTLCIDACDEMMEKVNRPKGLIRYASYNNIEQGTKFNFTTRMKAYSAVLVALVGLVGYLLFGRSTVEATILRAPGILYQEPDANTISNLYNIQVANKTGEAKTVSFRIKDNVGSAKMIGQFQTLTVEPRGIAKSSMFVYIPKSKLTERSTHITIELQDATGEVIETTETTFLYK